jgi:hypothetical protein
MRTVATWTVAVIIGLAALVGLVSVINARDPSGVDQHSSVAAGPGRPYRGEPVLSPALQDAVERGNVVVLYRDAQPPPGTEQLVPPGGAALVKAGQSVLLERESTLATRLAAISAQKIEEANRPQQLSEFIDYWLGGR